MVSTNKDCLIQVLGLSLTLPNGKKIWKSLDCEFHKGKIYSIVGESGSGKTSFVLSLFGILPGGSNLSYKTFTVFGMDWKGLTAADWQGIRGARICLVPQNPHNAFHPYRKVGSQLMEFLDSKARSHEGKIWNRDRILDLWSSMGIRDPKAAFASLPSQLSGGEKQRIAISLADMSGAEVIIADEPTSALDPIQARSVMDLLLSTIREKNRCLIFISHNLKLVMRVSDEVLVVQSGELVEKNTNRNGEFSPWSKNYSRQLWEA